MKTKDIKNQIISSLVAMAIKWVWYKLFHKETEKCHRKSSQQ